MDKNRSQDPIRYWSDQIDREMFSDIDFSIFLPDQEPEPYDPARERARVERHHCAMFVYQGARLHALLRLPRGDSRRREYDLRKELMTMAGSIQTLEIESQLSDQVLRDAHELFRLLGGEDGGDILPELTFLERVKLRSRMLMHPGLFRAAMDIAGFCLNNDQTELGVRFLERMARRFVEITPDVRIRRTILQRIMQLLVDADPERCCALGREQEALFRGIENEDACLYLRYYGFSAYRLGLMEKAVELLTRCAELCDRLGGPGTWLAFRARSACAVARLNGPQAPAAEQELEQMLLDLDAGRFRDPEPGWEAIREIVRHSVLQSRMHRNALADSLPQLERFYGYCLENEETVRDPILTVRSALVLLSGYYLEQGAYLSAARCTMDALKDTGPEGLEPYVSDDLLFSNLLLVVCRLNDREQILRVLELLGEKIEQLGEDLDEFRLYRYVTLQNLAAEKLGHRPEAEELENLRIQILDLAEELRERKDASEEVDNRTAPAMAMCILGQISALSEYAELAAEDMDAMEFVLLELCRYPLNGQQQGLLTFTRAHLAHRRGDGRAVELMRCSLKQLRELPVDHESRLRLESFGACVLLAEGELLEAADLARQSLEGITRAWHSAMAYVNDNRVCEVLASADHSSRTDLAVLSRSLDPVQLYGQVLRFKDLPTLAGRERSRILRLAPADGDLRERIRALQNCLAAAQLADARFGTDTAGAISEELIPLEAEFADRFPKNNQYTPITPEAVAERIPRGAAVVEYFFLPQPGLYRPGEEPDAQLHVFLLRGDGAQTLRHLILPEASAIVEQAGLYVEMFLNPGRYAARGQERTRLCAWLYRKLIEPLLPWLEQVETLYIAPDLELSNLPFELLHTGSSGMVQDRFRVCRIVCGRDLLFDSADAGTAPGRFILGDPEYEAEIGPSEIAGDRGLRVRMGTVDRLPFSGLEAWRVSRLCRSAGVTGTAATKYALMDALPAGVIHLATHGVFCPGLTGIALYDSFLPLAGYNRWARNQEDDSARGSGLLTADEISRMDLRKTELVVLSACCSGMGEAEDGTVRGLVSAFSAAGARWVVCHLWHAQDLACAVFMDLFYRAHLTMGMEVPDALLLARRALRDMTADRLRAEGWFDPDHRSRLPEEAKAYLHELATLPGDAAPFQNERCWGGFVCYRCN